MGQKHRPKPEVAGNWPGNLHVDAMKDDKLEKLEHILTINCILRYDFQPGQCVIIHCPVRRCSIS